MERAIWKVCFELKTRLEIDGVGWLPGRLALARSGNARLPGNHSITEASSKTNSDAFHLQEVRRRRSFHKKLFSNCKVTG